MSDAPNEDETASSAAASERWTCDACGCNTNQASDRTCSICGTSNGPSLLRRAPGYARAGWFARGLSARRGIMNEEDEDLWESVVDGAVDLEGDAESAMESLAMDVAGMVSAARSARLENQNNNNNNNNGLETSRQRFLEAARAFSQANHQARGAGERGSDAQPPAVPLPDPQELLQAATENAPAYHTRWANPSLMGGRVRSGNGIEVGEGERQNLAHLPTGAGMGRAIRAQEALPRSGGGASGDPFGSSDFSSSLPLVMASNNDNEERPRRAFGFRVAFDHPNRQAGESMGGCYLVGVTTASFTAYGDQNGLQQSPFFWGIEDSGHKYEGSRTTGASSSSSSRASRRVSSSTYATELTAQDVPMNAARVLFGSREVVTVVCDFDTRTLTFWRDETLLGTLVTNLPRSGNLFPVAVPFNNGVTVAITGLDNDPLPLLRTFATDWRKEQQEKDDKRREKLVSQRAMLMEKGKPTSLLLEALKTIFGYYTQGDCSTLDYVAASRLWYRCGMKLAALDTILEEKSSDSAPVVAFEDFCGVIERIVEEDDKTFKEAPSTEQASEIQCEVGDKVELVDGYEKYGDASGGPLQPGERGAVVELQRGPNGERRSVRVLHNGRRWWYQPQAVLSERSGLIESPGVWFLHRMLRAHGFDHSALEPLSGKPVTKSSWCVGDVVVPKKADASTEPTMESVGFITAESSSSSSSLVAQGREAGTVAVEFISRKFAEEAGAVAPSPSASESSFTLDTRRIRASKLVHSSLFRSTAGASSDPSDTEDKKPAADDPMEIDDTEPAPSSSISDKLRSELAAMKRLDRTAIEAIKKECKKNPESLANLFSAGLPDAIFTAIDVAEKQMNSLEPREDLTEKIAAIGDLATFIAEQLFSSQKENGPSASKAQVPPSNPTAAASRSHRGRSGANDHSRDRPRSLREAVARREAALARREAQMDEDRGADPQGMGSSLQQRRSMLLSLMSRARRSNASYLNQMMERGNGAGIGLEQLAPPLGLMRRGQPFVMNPPGDFGEDGNWDDPGPFGTSAEDNAFFDEDGVPPSLAPPALSEARQSKTYLDSVLRSQGDSLSSLSSGMKDTGATTSVFVRHLVSTGLLVDSFPWVKALVDAQTKKSQIPSLHRSSTVLRNAVDEEGTPLLRLAVSLGCSAEILELLITNGASVGEKDVKKAALTNQARSLSHLLRHTSFTEGLVDPSACSPAVASVFAEAKVRQDELASKMRDAAGAFMVQLLRRLLALGLSSRRHQSSRVDLCSKAISELLVGDVLLRALQRTQEGSSASTARDLSGGQEPCDGSGRFPVEEDSDQSLTARGLLGSLPETIVVDALLSDAECTTTFLLLVEDYLCSKDMNDAAAGLTFLSTLLKRVPGLQSCSQMTRYGMAELVTSHEVLASSRLTEITSRLATDGSDAPATGSSRSNRAQQPGSIQFLSSDTREPIVVCPKKHTAVLHITRHSSFRCDICGSGVERGRPMHGCRECDWDACEDCMDKAESGIVKCSAIHELAAECQALLSGDGVAEQDVGVDSKLIAKMSGDDNSDKLKALSIRVMERDIAALKELATMLESPGCVTMHQFMTVILPSLHASLMGSLSSGECSPAIKGHSGRRSKKARVVGGSARDNEEASFDSTEERISFGEDIVRFMVMEQNESEGMQIEASKPESSSEDETKAPPDNKYLEVSVAASEVLRRIQKVLSFFEALPVGPGSSGKRSVPTGSQGGDLQSLKKTIEIHLAPSTFQGTEAEHQNPIIVNAEPLIPIADLEQHVLQNFRINDPSYIDYCERLNADSAIIVERPARASEASWQLAQVTGFDEATGTHCIRYASKWKRGQRSRRSLRISQENTDDLVALRYDGAETHVVLAARHYFVLHRGASLPRGSNRTRGNQQGTTDMRPREMVAVLKKSWSALSLIESMKPIELNIPDEGSKIVATGVGSDFTSWKCSLGDSEVQVVSETAIIELPPRVSVTFALHEKMPGVEISQPEFTTLIGTLKQLHNREDKLQPLSVKGSYKLFFSINAGKEAPSKLDEHDRLSFQLATKGEFMHPTPQVASLEETRAGLRKLSSRSFSEDDETEGRLCDGLDEICIQCMEVVSFLAEIAEDSSIPKEKVEQITAAFSNGRLSQKLTEQLDDPVTVVGGALPDWCTLAPSFAPRVFSYESRRMLLQRSAFGASRSTLVQQEAKINVGRLRTRMGALRARAVELVGEAFSCGAEDPTALQLQADELYGMEEALAARVRAAFRAVKWHEHSLQVAKAAVRREHLLSDAEAMMECYANDESVCRRRLEVRFDGESGFDAASGDEAGVTRGFYADVAEALLASDTVAGVYCSSSCSYVSPTASLSKVQMDVDEMHKEASKLPLWIPDMDSSAQVVIPTPRADKRSGLGVYPRPLPSYHPQMADVLLRFRFMGRLFASAVRDNFMFPLPLSAAFLKLVQFGSSDMNASAMVRGAWFSPRDANMTALDLPRPGFLGGEVYAADHHIGKALDRLDCMDPPLPRSELQKRYKEIATDKNFARVALGKSYDCSFEDYFQDRTFVDPLDPTQGEDAVPLLPNGHRKSVTIYNVREWVELAKSFILYDGVVAQAVAFRKGVEDFFSANYLRLFTAEELQRDVCGAGDDVDNWDESAVRKLFKLDGGKGATEALVAVAAIGGEGGAALSRRFGPSSPTITFLVKALLEASPKQRRQFLSFVTSVPIVTPGKIEVVPIVSPNGEFLPMQDPSCLPRANTCARRMYLPKFETYESFTQVLWAVVREESKFKGFYEWRGSHL